MIYTISIYQSRARGALLVAEGDDGVNAEGAAGWDVAGEERDGYQENGYGCEGYGIASAYGEEQAGEQAG